MPNPVLKFLTIFEGNEGYGWTEQHFKQASSANPQLDVALNNYILGVVAARSAILASDCSIVGARVSYPSPPSVSSYGLRQKISGTVSGSGAAPALSLAVQWKNANFTKSKIVHLRGFPDAVEADESYHPELLPGWEDRLQAWKNALTQGSYGWLSKDPTISSQGDVSGYAVGTDHRVTFTLAAPGIPVQWVGTRQQIRFSRFGNGKSILNRSLLCDITSTTQAVTVQKIGADPTSTTGKYNFRATSLVLYSNTGSISLGERRMGKVLNRYPGRAPAKALI